MTRQHEFIEQLEAYLDEYEGVTPLPESVRSAVRRDLPNVKQVGSPSGLRSAPEPVGYLHRDGGLARLRYRLAAAVTVAAVAMVGVTIAAVAVGAALLTRGGSVGGPEDTPNSAPTLTGTVQPTTTPAPASLAEQTGRLHSGTYEVGGSFPVPITFSLPFGWSYGTVSASEATILKNGGDAPEGMGLSFRIVDNLYADPCQPALGPLQPPAGPEVEDLAAALSALPGYLATTPAEVTHDGFAGVRMELIASADSSSCAGGVIAPWIQDGAEAGGAAGQRHELRILDADGTRLVIDAWTYGDTSPQHRTELREVIESVRIGR